MSENLEMQWRIEDTIKNLESIKKMLSKLLCKRGYEDNVKELEFDLGRAKEALKKQIPMKVCEIHVDKYRCPRCLKENGCNDAGMNDEYCPKCGQRLMICLLQNRLE